MADFIEERLQRSIREKVQREEEQRQAQAQKVRQKEDEEARQATRARMATDTWDNVISVLPDIAKKIVNESGNNYKMTSSGRPNPTPFLRSTTLEFRETNAMSGMTVFVNLRQDLLVEFVSDVFNPFTHDVLQIEKVAFTEIILDLFDRFLNPKEA